MTIRSINSYTSQNLKLTCFIAATKLVLSLDCSLECSTIKLWRCIKKGTSNIRKIEINIRQAWANLWMCKYIFNKVVINIISNRKNTLAPWRLQSYLLFVFGVVQGLLSTSANCKCFKADSYSWVTLNINPKRRWTSCALWNPGDTYKSCWNAFTALEIKLFGISKFVGNKSYYVWIYCIVKSQLRSNRCRIKLKRSMTIFSQTHFGYFVAQVYYA